MNTGFWAGLFGWLFGKEKEKDIEDIEETEGFEDPEDTEEGK